MASSNSTVDADYPSGQFFKIYLNTSPTRPEVGYGIIVSKLSDIPFEKKYNIIMYDENGNIMNCVLKKKYYPYNPMFDHSKFSILTPSNEERTIYSFIIGSTQYWGTNNEGISIQKILQDAYNANVSSPASSPASSLASSPASSRDNSNTNTIVFDSQGSDSSQGSVGGKRSCKRKNKTKRRKSRKSKRRRNKKSKRR